MMLMTKCLPSTTSIESFDKSNDEQRPPPTIKQSKHTSNRNHINDAGGERCERPALSYKDLIIEAIENSPSKRLKLNEIYNVIRILHPYYRMRPDQWGWQNSIRHNLSLHDCFVKLPLKETTSNGVVGHYWAVVPESIDKVTIGGSGGTSTRRRSRVDRTHLRNPLKIGANNSHRLMMNRRSSLAAQHQQPTIDIAPPLSAGLFFSKFMCNTSSSNNSSSIFQQQQQHSSTVTTITTVDGSNQHHNGTPSSSPIAASSPTNQSPPVKPSSFTAFNSFARNTDSIIDHQSSSLFGSQQQSFMSASSAAALAAAFAVANNNSNNCSTIRRSSTSSSDDTCGSNNSSLTSPSSTTSSSLYSMSPTTTTAHQQQLIDDYRQQYTQNLLQSFFYTQGLIAALAHMAELSGGSVTDQQAYHHQFGGVGRPTHHVSAITGGKLEQPQLSNYTIGGGLQLPISRPEATTMATVGSSRTFY